MSTLFISAPGALNQNEVNRHRNQNGVIADTQMSSTHSAMITAMNAAKLENSSTILSPKEQQQVIIVGAGIAGLRAASVLKRHGVGVTILEGRPDRIGGRICTSRKHGKAARDIGKYT